MFDEGQHPRDDGGKFTDKGGGSRENYTQSVNDRIKWAKENGVDLPLNTDGSVDDLKLQELYEKGKDRKASAPAADKTTIKEQVKAGLEKIEGTKILSEIPKGKIITDFQTAATTLRMELENTGGVVSREGFGDVQVSSRLKQAAAYVKSPAEIAAVSAVPTIIKDGVLVDEHKSHKGRGYPTYLFAGKVSVGGKEGIMAVAVKKTTGNFYKVHRVLTPNGKDLKIENDTD